MKKKLFLILAVSLLTTNTFAEKIIVWLPSQNSEFPSYADAVSVQTFNGIWEPSEVPELPCYTDPVVETTLSDDDTPL